MRAKKRFAHVSDSDLLRRLDEAAARDCTNTAEMIELIAEVDSRKLHVPLGYHSIHAYCVGKLGLSEDAAYKRIQAARAAEDFPAIVDVLAEGRIHLTGVVLLAPHLEPGNADELLQAAERKTKAEIELLLARRFPRSETLPLVVAVSDTSSPPRELVPEPGVTKQGWTGRRA